jgi:hypothetical protein
MSKEKNAITFKDADQLMDHPPLHVRFKGVWDMQDLYEFMANYFKERKYKFYEKIYKHKHPSPYGVERQYCWHAETDVDDVYVYNIDVYMHTYDAHDIEVKTKEGNIRTFTKGRIWIELICHIKMYENHSWLKNRLWANLRIFLNNYIMRKKHGWDSWDVIYYRDVHKLVWLIRRRLKMEYDEYEQKYWTGVHG